MKRAPLIFLLLCWLLFGAYYSGNETVTTSGTPVQLSAASPVPPTSCISLTVQAKSTNAGTIWIGGSNVSAANKIGLALTNGATPPASAYFSPSSTTALYTPQSIYIDATNSGDGVTYGCFK